MTDLIVTDLTSMGYAPDPAPNSLPNNAWTYVRNWRFRDEGYPQVTEGYTNALQLRETPRLAYNGSFLYPWNSLTNVPELFYVTDAINPMAETPTAEVRHITSYITPDGSTDIEETVVGTVEFPEGVENAWSGSEFFGRPLFNNTRDKPYAILDKDETEFTLQTLPKWPESFRSAQHLTSFRGTFLVAIGVEQDGVSNRRNLHISDVPLTPGVFPQWDGHLGTGESYRSIGATPGTAQFSLDRVETTPSYSFSYTIAVNDGDVVEGAVAGEAASEAGYTRLFIPNSSMVNSDTSGKVELFMPTIGAFATGMGDGIRVQVTIDGGSPQTISFNVTEGVFDRDEIGTEIATNLNSSITGGTATYNADDNIITVSSDSTGADSMVELVFVDEEDSLGWRISNTNAPQPRPTPGTTAGTGGYDFRVLVDATEADLEAFADDVTTGGSVRVMGTFSPGDDAETIANNLSAAFGMVTGVTTSVEDVETGFIVMVTSDTTGNASNVLIWEGPGDNEGLFLNGMKSNVSATSVPGFDRAYTGVEILRAIIADIETNLTNVFVGIEYGEEDAEDPMAVVVDTITLETFSLGTGSEISLQITDYQLDNTTKNVIVMAEPGKENQEVEYTKSDASFSFYQDLSLHTQGELLYAEELNDVLYIFTTTNIIAVRYDGDGVFRTTVIHSDNGVLSPRSVVKIPNGWFCIGANQIYTIAAGYSDYEGQIKTLIGEGIWRETWYNTLEENALDQLQCLYDPRTSTVWILTPVGEGNKEVWLYNLHNNTASVLDDHSEIRYLSYSQQGLPTDTLIIDTLPIAWTVDTIPVENIDDFPSLLSGRYRDRVFSIGGAEEMPTIFIHDQGPSYNGRPINAVLQKNALLLKQGQRDTTTVNRVIPLVDSRVDNASMRISVGRSKLPNGDPSFRQERTFDATKSEKADFRVNTRYPAIRFTSSVSGLALYSYEVDATQTNKR